jgi:hypothetical protein
MAEEIFDGIQRCIDDESLYLSVPSSSIFFKIREWM